MKQELNNNKIETKLKKEASSFTISKSAEDILQAYKCRKANKETEVIKAPIYKKTWFKAVAACSIVGIIAGSTLGIYFGLTNKNNTVPFFSAPVLSTSQDKLIFETNNVAGFLIENNYLALAKKSRILKQSNDSELDSEDESEDESESEESESEDNSNVTSAQLDDIASTYHSLFSLLEKSSSDSGTFKVNSGSGKKYKYYSEEFGYVLSTDTDPSLLSGSFNADLSFSNYLYTINGTEESDCLSLDIILNNKSVMTLKEEKDSLRVKRSKFTFQMTYGDVKDVIYYDSDFSSDDDDKEKERDIEISLTRYTFGKQTEYYSFDSEFLNSKADVEFTYKKEGFYFSGEMEEKIKGNKSTFYFEEYSYQITI